jgi:hypothetical protein
MEVSWLDMTKSSKKMVDFPWPPGSLHQHHLPAEWPMARPLVSGPTVAWKSKLGQKSVPKVYQKSAFFQFFGGLSMLNLSLTSRLWKKIAKIKNYAVWTLKFGVQPLLPNPYFATSSTSPLRKSTRRQVASKLSDSLGCGCHNPTKLGDGLCTGFTRSLVFGIFGMAVRFIYSYIYISYVWSLCIDSRGPMFNKQVVTL